MRLTKIYTKIGDKGTTMLAGGGKAPKDSPRIEAYGDVDELNANLGFWRDLINREIESNGSAGGLTSVVEKLATIQNEMHDLGGELSTPFEVLKPDVQQVVTGDSIARLESDIDAINAKLPPLANFILPGGHVINSQAHICRTICRRTERRVVALAGQEQVRDEPRIYLNRLSDWLFVAGRLVSKELNIPEVEWQQAKK